MMRSALPGVRMALAMRGEAAAEASRDCMEAGDAPDAARGGGVEGGVAVDMTAARRVIERSADVGKSQICMRKSLANSSLKAV